ncbi:aminotransferase class III-fold pyridoxal phosphate-dependent enzyme [Nannocystis sp. SCPEA4]|uniref:aminotransferase class III-fold pyridoxal phosphate-dependent enzyme n=1 Tax=Nannocystis sp. SCPEA4 TaxID=2996787 RepID=UPI00227049AE|nr:aminotransferase class III-fold pyridoxal phosphate-dependent enzyme [Nannocystis sp. SCPEA4]MCY1060364.1 aminotransferase class III-fold pyridoxal phosphate-dependent enzyme [Nannocystis sp. SCPEA4]
MDSRTIIELSKQHTMWSWSKSGPLQPLAFERAEGVYLYTPEGKRYLDFNSQLMSVNIGHSHPKVLERMKQAIDGHMLFAAPSAATPVRARLGKRLAELVPGDINSFFFTLGGAEANENAIKAARLYTGRHKILSRYRSYHGATHAAMQMTGDPRRWANEPGASGFVRVMDPIPYDYSFGTSDSERTANHLRYLEEVIQYEGPHTIAAMFVETVIGTNGIQPPPAGWLPGLRALLDRYGILLVCDEVMCGFGRTGKLFAFEHFGAQPDILTMAKGLTSSYVPLGAMGVTDKIAAHFRDNVFWGGLTYNAHPFCLAVAEAVLDVMLEEDMVGNAARMQEVMLAEMAALKARHPSVRDYRAIGLFGAIELQKDRQGTRMAPYNGSHPAIDRMMAFFKQEGLFTISHWWTLMCNPPLCITEAELREGFAIIDRGLAITDEAVEG